jgi:hypothetical protein
MERIEHIERDNCGLRSQLQNHKLFKNLKTVRNIKVFMKNHIFSLWYFISLYKDEYKKWKEFLSVSKQSLQIRVLLCYANNDLIENEKSYI